jgi:hypothetical protein
MRSGYNVYSFVENSDPDELSKKYIDILEGEKIEAEFVSGSDFNSNWKEEFRRIKFRSDSVWIDFYHPEKGDGGSYVISYMSIQPETDMYDRSVQKTLINIVRQIGRRISPQVAYIGNPMGVASPNDEKENPDLGIVTYFGEDMVGKFEVNLHATPECNVEAVNSGVLIYPEGNIMDKTLDRAAEYLGTSLVDRPD